MSKSTIVGFIAGVVSVCIVIGIVVWARSTVNREERDVVRKAVGEAAQQSARQVADEGIRKDAKDVSDKLLAGMDKGGTPPQPSVEVAQVETEIQVDREAFDITLPPGSTVDPEDKSTGGERVFSASLPGHCMTSIVVIDKKERAQEYQDEAVASIKKTVENATEYWPNVLDSFKVAGTKGFLGTIKGDKFAFETGNVQGRDKACVIIVEFPAEDRDQVVPRLKKALDTFQMKQ